MLEVEVTEWLLSGWAILVVVLGGLGPGLALPNVWATGPGLFSRGLAQVHV